jgi:hypothetical protein
MSFGYPTQYANGLNSNSQLRRSTDMIYQRGGTYEVILTGTTYESSLELNVDLYSDDRKVGRMSIVPYNVAQSGNTYTYKFNIRPYDYLSNYVKSEHYTNYYLNDWYSTNELINLNNPYPNSIKGNFKYGYSYINGTTQFYEPLTGSTPTTTFQGINNDYNHYTSIPYCATSTGFTASGFTNTGNYFNYVGGNFEMGREKFILSNFDQELGTVMGTGLTINTVDRYRLLSPMSQYLFDYPTVPEMSETSRFLTDAPRIQYIQNDENYVLYYLNGQTGDRQVIEADYVVFEYFDESNTRIGGYNQQINFSGTTYASPTGNTNTLRIFALPCGPKDINNIFDGIDFDTVAYYTVQIYYSYPTNMNSERINNGPIGPSSECFYFYLDTNCGPQDTRLAWLNNRGGFDYFTFTSYRQDTKKITRQTYDNRYYSTSQQSPDRNIGRTVKTFDTNVDREFVLESDYINVQYGEWMQQLFYSPQVYEVKEDYISPLNRQDYVYKDLRPIQILSTEVETITKKHKKLNKYRITCKYADGFFVSKGF